MDEAVRRSRSIPIRSRNGVPSVYWVSSGVPNLDMLAACGAMEFHGSISGLVLRNRRTSLTALLVSCIGLSSLDDGSRMVEAEIVLGELLFTFDKLLLDFK